MGPTTLATAFAWPARLAALVVAVSLSPALTGPALAQLDADFSAYCRANFPNSMYEKQAHSQGIKHVCNQGGTRQGIDLDEACRLTTGTAGHRIAGARVICDGSAGGAAAGTARDAGALDLPQRLPQ